MQFRMLYDSRDDRNIYYLHTGETSRNCAFCCYLLDTKKKDFSPYLVTISPIGETPAVSIHIRFEFNLFFICTEPY